MLSGEEERAEGVNVRERPVNAAATAKLMRRRLDRSSITVSAVLTPVRLGIGIISSGSIDGRSIAKPGKIKRVSILSPE
jgi:hypothetical protein